LPVEFYLFAGYYGSGGGADYRGRDATAEFTGGAGFTAAGNVWLGREYGVTFMGYNNNTIDINGNGTVFDMDNRILTLHSRDNLLRVRDGGVFANASELRIGRNAGGTTSYGNMVDAAAGGEINAATITLSAVENSIRTSGGTINCTTLNIGAGNILAPRVTKDGTGKIHVSGTVTFGANSYVFPSAEEGVPTGTYEIMTFDDIAGDGLDPNGLPALIPGPDDKNAWTLFAKQNALILRFSQPRTIVIVR